MDGCMFVCMYEKMGGEVDVCEDTHAYILDQDRHRDKDEDEYQEETMVDCDDDGTSDNDGGGGFERRRPHVAVKKQEDEGHE